MSKAHAAHVAPHDRVRIAAAASVSPDTVRRFIARTVRTHETTKRRIEAAAESLGVALPPADETRALDAGDEGLAPIRVRNAELDAEIDRVSGKPGGDLSPYRNFRALFGITRIDTAVRAARQLGIPAVRRDLRVMVRWADVEALYNAAREASERRGGLTLAELLEMVDRLPPGARVSCAGRDRAAELLQLLLDDTNGRPPPPRER